MVGPLIAFLVELTWEIIENSPCVINLFRHNSGTSAQYEGDAVQNIGRRGFLTDKYLRILDIS